MHRIQTSRNAGGLVRLARAKVADGKPLEALGLYARYLAYEPNDAIAQAEFARLLIKRTERPEATKNERGYAYGVLETAVRKNPDDLLLRRQLAEWMLRFGRFGDALVELDTLRDQMTSAPTDAAGERPDPAALEVLRGYALLGRSEFRAAAETAAAILGFDLDSLSFPPQTELPDARVVASGRTAFDAASLLAGILSERLEAPEAASQVLEHLVALNPDDFQAWLTLARWKQSRGDFVGANAAIRKAAELGPEEPDVLYTDLELALAEKRFAVADRLAAKARELFPRDERTFRGLASVAVQQRDSDTAVNVLREGLADQPGRPSLLLMLADVLLQADRLEEAEETIRTFVGLHGGTMPAIGMLDARLLVAQKRWLRAKQRLDEVRPLVAESNTLTRQVDLLLGQCHEMLGQFDEQLAANQRVLSEDHESLAARIGAASALASSGKPDAARDEYEAIAATLSADRLPQLPQVWGPLLQLRIEPQMKRPAAQRDWSSVDTLLDVLDSSPFITAAQMAVLRADVLVRKGDSAAAIAVLDKLVKDDPASPQPLASLALLTLRRDGPEAARAILARAPAAIKDDPMLLLCRVQLASREPPEASQAALKNLEAKARDLPPDQAVRLLAAIASTHRGAGASDEAERVWKAALERRPDDLAVRGAIFELACERRDVEKAEAAAAEIARLAGPTSPQGRLALAAALVLAVQNRTSSEDAATGGLLDAATMPAGQLEQLTAARNLLIEAENDRPGWSQIQQLLAEISLLQGDIPTAIERLQQALRLGPANPAVIRRLVSLFYLTNRLDEAQQALAIIGPDGLGGMERLSAEIELKTGQFDDAVALAERSLAGKQQNTAGDLLWFGQLLGRAGQIERAGEALRLAVETDPGLPAAWLALFSTQLATGQRRAAEKTLEDAAEHIAPPQRELVIAQGYESLGRIEDAERGFREAVAAAPADQAVVGSLAAFFLRRGRLTAAREQLEAIVAADGGDTAAERTRRWARRTLAEMTARGGRYRDAQRAIDLLEANIAGSDRPAPEDLVLEVGILASRPEPASWRRALDVLGKLAAQQPLSNEQRIRKAVLLEKLGRWGECRDELLSIASAPNTPPAFQSLLIEKLVQHGELRAAQIWLKALADRLPDAPIVSALQARLSLAENNRPAAIAATRKLMPGDTPRPELAGHLGSLGGLLEELGFDAAADRVFTDFAATSADGAMARAGFLGRKLRGDEALDLLEASWDRIPLDNLLRQAVVVLDALGPKMTSGQSDRVGRWFAKALREDPDSTSLWLLKADYAGISGDRDGVIAIYRDLLNRKGIDPGQAAVVANNLAFHLATPETAAEANALVDRALEELGPHPDVLDTRGVVLLETGKAEEALADLKEAIVVPTATKYLHLASALVAVQQVDAARKAFAEAKRLGLSTRSLTPGDLQRVKDLESMLGS